MRCTTSVTYAAGRICKRNLRFLTARRCKVPRSYGRAGSAASAYTNGRSSAKLVGQIYVQQTFGAQGKERTLAMVEALEKSLGEDIKGLPWMGAETKAQALVKLQAITNRIGYPEKWRDYSALQIVRGDALGNSQRANRNDLQRRLNKIGKALDKRDWPYPPMTINATYNDNENNITFPPAFCSLHFSTTRPTMP